MFSDITSEGWVVWTVAMFLWTGIQILLNFPAIEE